ncbi:FAD-dependent oxidoreductase [Billgrantia kenyensis]|uniref:FAD-dependent oxidoreductase n=1 Tax=Billgrantia kenyensis TaxID=321266 RepID=A0A7W0AFW3_9GAMM|nr:FAD-dependent oxidoreductase [Halomonas kenyensis]MBA2781120.1 FAD-dependent oxidoreductase [Halomonas kenyensis]MCG6659944.1 FAD-dependent oxidoreductase [Halomonas kenyensis]
MDLAPLRVAIIGGGVSGLSLAYYLQKLGCQKLGDEAAHQIEVTLFERKASLGGNAETVWVDLGNRRLPGKPEMPYRRWADLGVNDVNLATYQRLRTILAELGELEHMKPLENSECYFSHDGGVALTDDRDLVRGVSDPAHELSLVDGGRLAMLIAVVHRSAINLVESRRITPRYTVDDFFDACAAAPAEMLSEAAEQLSATFDWDDPELSARLERIRHTVYYPRISAMYFADDRGPGGMPLQAPFEYYRLQEGGSPPDRRYFEHGAQHWLEALAAHVTGPLTPGPRVEILRGIEVEARLSTQGVTLTERAPGDRRWEADLLIMATHAEDALPLLTFDDDLNESQRELQHILGKVRYTRSFGVCHTSAARLPPNPNLWRTRNIEVRGREDTFHPYRIDYVVNRHQNDAENPCYDRAGLPQFFVSLVDDLNRIPRSEMLDRHAAPPDAPESLAGAGLGAAGYRDRLPAIESALEAKAWTLFKHNVLDADCLEAQAEIERYHQSTARKRFEGQRDLCPLLFAGGWTRGAGLQEQCLEQSAHLVALLLAAPERRLNPLRLAASGGQARQRHSQAGGVAPLPASL